MYDSITFMVEHIIMFTWEWPPVFPTSVIWSYTELIYSQEHDTKEESSYFEELCNNISSAQGAQMIYNF